MPFDLLAQIRHKAAPHSGLLSGFRRCVIKQALPCLLLLLGGSLILGARQQQTPTPSPTPDALAHAKSVFKDRCARCHGMEGDGSTTIGSMVGAPDFTNPTWWTRETTDARLIHTVTHGKGEMPAFGKKLSPREIASLVTYIRQFNKSTISH